MNRITRTATAAAMLAAVAAGALIGHARLDADTVQAPAWQPVTVTPAPATPPTMTADQRAGWDLYRTEIDQDAEGCWQDFAESYLGWVADGDADSTATDLFFLHGDHGRALVLAPYQGACQNL